LLVRSCGCYLQNLYLIVTVKKLNIVIIVLHISIKRVGIEITVTTAFYAVRDVDVKREWHSGYCLLLF
jgi:hypothetical protein